MNIYFLFRYLDHIFHIHGFYRVFLKDSFSCRGIGFTVLQKAKVRYHSGPLRTDFAFSVLWNATSLHSCLLSFCILSQLITEYGCQWCLPGNPSGTVPLSFFFSNLPPTGRFQGRSKGERRHHPCVLLTSQNPSHWNPCWPRDAHTTRKDPKSE